MWRDTKVVFVSAKKRIVKLTGGAVELGLTFTAYGEFICKCRLYARSKSLNSTASLFVHIRIFSVIMLL